jgi:hypothetical protein
MYLPPKSRPGRAAGESTNLVSAASKQGNTDLRGGRKGQLLVHDGFGNKIVRDNPPYRSLSKQDNQTFIQNVVNTRAWWFCAHSHATDHTTLEEARTSKDAYTFLESRGKLSREELGLVLSRCVGNPIILDHEEDGETMGEVDQAYQDADTGALMIRFRAYDTPAGRHLAMLLAYRMKEGISMQHAHRKIQIQLREFSLCFRGARPDTWLVYEVEVKGFPGPIANRSRPYSHPRFEVPSWAFSANTFPVYQMESVESAQHAASKIRAAEQQDEYLPGQWIDTSSLYKPTSAQATPAVASDRRLFAPTTRHQVRTDCQQKHIHIHMEEKQKRQRRRW